MPRIVRTLVILQIVSGMSKAFSRCLPCFLQNFSLDPLPHPLLVLNFPCSDTSYPYCGMATVNVGSEILTNWDCYQSVYVRALDVETTVLFTSFAGASSTAISTPITSPITTNNNVISTNTFPTFSDTSTTSPSTSSSTSGPSNPSTSHAGAIAGGVVGGLAGLGLVVAGAIFWLHRRKQMEMRVTPPEVSQAM
jgi:Trk-type K+ transport system membrane component